MFLVWLLSFNSYRLIDVSVWLVGSTSVTHLFWIIIQQKSCVRTFHQCSFSRAGQLNMYISSILSITLQTAFRNFQTGDSHLKIIEKLILKSKKNNNKVAFFFLGVFFFFLMVYFITCEINVQSFLQRKDAAKSVDFNTIMPEMKLTLRQSNFFFPVLTTITMLAQNKRKLMKKIACTWYWWKVCLCLIH